jgi:hypothetical protein
MSCAGIVGERYQFLADDCIGFGVNYADICGTRMRCANFDRHGEDLVWCKRLDVGAVVGKLVAFADGKVACCGVEVFLVGADLKFGLDISFVVGRLVVKDF